MSANMFLSLLLLLFVGLKLGGILAWSWWWVLTPLWAPLLLALAALALQGIAWLCMSPEERKRAKVVRALESYADALSRKPR